MTIDINTHSKSHRLVLHTQERAEHAQIPTLHSDKAQESHKGQ
jgi:hypothetical protein